MAENWYSTSWGLKWAMRWSLGGGGGGGGREWRGRVSLTVHFMWSPHCFGSALIKASPSQEVSWPKNVESVQVFLFAGFVLLPTNVCAWERARTAIAVFVLLPIHVYARKVCRFFFFHLQVSLFPINVYARKCAGFSLRSFRIVSYKCLCKWSTSVFLSNI